jgi:hypothetical protein
MVLEERLETLCGGQVFDGQRSLATVMAPQHPVGVPDATLALRWAFAVELRGIEPLASPAEIGAELRRLFDGVVKATSLCPAAMRRRVTRRNSAS